MADRAKMVKCAFYRKPMICVPGYGSCSPHFDIAKGSGREWQVIHVPTGLCQGHYKTLRQARFMIGALSGLSFDWSRPERWAAWQKANAWLMPWFRATGQIMYRIG